LEETFGDAWPPTNIGQISTTLDRLKCDGFVCRVRVVQEHRPEMRVYEYYDDG
jgi:DNA-binding PadR family transcriptional regulator